MRWYLAANVVVAASLCGCTGRPTGDPLTRAGFDTTELIAYRTLTRDDFRAPFALGFSVTEEKRIGATTCAKISVRPELATRSERSATGEARYVASLDDPIFFAVFSRKCSWWNPAATGPESFLLEHEQVHFAIAELEARRLNGRAEDIAQRVRTAGTDERGVYFHAESELQKILATAEEALEGRNELFHTQIYPPDPAEPPDPLRQRQWFHKVMAELEATEILARGPQLYPPVSAPSASALAQSAPTPAASPSPLPTPAAVAAPPAPPPATTPRPVVPPMPAPTPTAPATPSSPSSTGSFPD